MGIIKFVAYDLSWLCASKVDSQITASRIKNAFRTIHTITILAEGQRKVRLPLSVFRTDRDKDGTVLYRISTIGGTMVTPTVGRYHRIVGRYPLAVGCYRTEVSQM